MNKKLLFFDRKRCVQCILCNRELKADLYYSSKLKPKIGPLHDPVTWYKVTQAGRKVARCDFHNKAIVPVHPDLPLFWKSHCATCVPSGVISYHVTGACKGSVVFHFTSKYTRSKTVPLSNKEKILQECSSNHTTRALCTYKVNLRRDIKTISKNKVFIECYLLTIISKN